MNRKLKYLLVTAACVLAFAAAWLIYDRLADDYLPDTAFQSQLLSSAAQTTAEPAASNVPSAPSQSLAAKTAPDFTVYDGDGNPVKLSNFFGKPIIVNFWATWCGPCRSELPAFETAYRLYGDDVTFLMVNLADSSTETPERVKRALEVGGYTFPVYYDLDINAARVYGVYSIPATLAIHADGSIFGGHVGTLSREQLFSVIESMLGGVQ